MCLWVALNPGWQAALTLRVCRHYDQLLKEYSAPKEGSKQLKFDTKYPKPMYGQFVAIFTKFMAAYWRMPGASALFPVQLTSWGLMQLS